MQRPGSTVTVPPQAAQAPQTIDEQTFEQNVKPAFFLTTTAMTFVRDAQTTIAQDAK